MNTSDFSGLKAIFVSCTLKKSPEKSKMPGLMDLSADIMKKEGEALDNIRLVDHDVPPGVFPDMVEHGWNTDEYPELFKRIFDIGPGPNYLDEDSDTKNNDFTNQTTTFMKYNLNYMVKMLKINSDYPSYGNSQKEWSEGKLWKSEKS